jgi:hypothetical protein
MGSIDPEARRALDQRYASGEISTMEYYRLKAVLTLSAREDITQTNVSELQLAPLFQFEDLAIYPTHITVAGNRRELSDISKIDGGSVNLRINLWSAVKDTSLSVSFRNGGTYKLREERSIFGGDRHRAIMQAQGLLKRLTFKPLFDKLVSEVREGPVQIGIENETAIDSVMGSIVKMLLPRKFAPIYLLRSGTLTNGKLTFDLKQCRRQGVLELGIRRANMSEPESVYVSIRKSVMERSHRGALRFGLCGEHRYDVTMALLNWMAEPENEL